MKNCRKLPKFIKFFQVQILVEKGRRYNKLNVFDISEIFNFVEISLDILAVGIDVFLDRNGLFGAKTPKLVKSLLWVIDHSESVDLF